MGVVTVGVSPWVFVSDNLTDCKLKWIVLPYSQSHWQHLIPPDTQVQWLMDDQSSTEEILRDVEGTDAGSHGGIDVLVFEGGFRPPRQASSMWKNPHLKLVLAERTNRGKPAEGWTISTRTVTHIELGGVTDCRKTMHVWLRDTDWNFFQPDCITGAPSHFTDLIHKTRTSKRVRPGTDAFRIGNSPVVAMETLQKDRRKKWILPTVFGKDALVKRTLEGDEVCSSLDVPAALFKQWNDATIETVARELTAPIKMAAALGSCISKWSTHREKSTPRTGDTEMINRASVNVCNEVDEDAGPTFDSAERMRGYVRTIGEEVSAEKAVKHDKAAVPIHLWNDRIRYLLGLTQLEEHHLRAFDALRNVMLTRWKRNVRTSWFKWWSQYESTIKSNEPTWWKLVQERGMQACRQAMKATFWAWPEGSGVFFWRWPEEYLNDVAIGVPPLWTNIPKPIIERQQGLGEPEMIEKIREKIDDVRNKGYVGPGSWSATMNYFAVPKGDSDIRMVYDGTKSGLNDCLYAPWFPLPDSDVLIRTLDEDYWCVDNDYGEMFLNFWLHPELQKFSGIDLTQLIGITDDGELYLEGWKRCPMGQSPSPFNTVQQTRRLKQIMLGNPQDSENVFRWDSVKINLPGTIDYKPGVPWIA